MTNANLKRLGDALLYGSGIGVPIAGFQQHWYIMAGLVITAVIGKYLSSLGVKGKKKENNDRSEGNEVQEETSGN